MVVFAVLLVVAFCWNLGRELLADLVEYLRPEEDVDEWAELTAEVDRIMAKYPLSLKDRVLINQEATMESFRAADVLYAGASR